MVHFVCLPCPPTSCSLPHPALANSVLPAVSWHGSSFNSGCILATSYLCHMCVLGRFSHVRLFATPWTVAHLCPWDSPGKNTGMGCHALFQGIFLTQGLNLFLLQLLHCRWTVEPQREAHLCPSQSQTEVLYLLKSHPGDCHVNS